MHNQGQRYHPHSKKKSHTSGQKKILSQTLCHLHILLFSNCKSRRETLRSCQSNEDLKLTAWWTSLRLHRRWALCPIPVWAPLIRARLRRQPGGRGCTRSTPTHASRGASGRATLQVSLSEKGAHQRPLHGWHAVCGWQLVIYHSWAVASGGIMINFTLPLSEISPINHLKLRVQVLL